MIKLRIPDMSCGHCVATVEGAVRTVDPEARFTADLAARTATIVAAADGERLREAIRAAGYDTEPDEA